MIVFRLSSPKFLIRSRSILIPRWHDLAHSHFSRLWACGRTFTTCSVFQLAFFTVYGYCFKLLLLLVSCLDVGFTFAALNDMFCGAKLAVYWLCRSLVSVHCTPTTTAMAAPMTCGIPWLSWWQWTMTDRHHALSARDCLHFGCGARLVCAFAVAGPFDVFGDVGRAQPEVNKIIVWSVSWSAVVVRSSGRSVIDEQVRRRVWYNYRQIAGRLGADWNLAVPIPGCVLPRRLVMPLSTRRAFNWPRCPYPSSLCWQQLPNSVMKALWPREVRKFPLL